MCCQLKILLVFMSTYICIFSTQATAIKKPLPPILDHYPNCDYIILENASINTLSLTPNKERTISDLLIKLRRKAAAAGADALILIDKSVKLKKSFKRTTSDATKLRYLVQYTAELIKQCEKVGALKGKRTTYNHLGHKINPALTHKTTTSFEVVQPKVAVKEVITEDNEVSIKNGLYGAKLKDTYQEVVAKLGPPSTIVNIMKDELVVGYGRRHWLHFQSNQLVKVQTRTSLLSQSALNKIPLHDQFDNDAWKINNKVTANMSLAETLNLLKINKPLNEKNQFIYAQADKELILDFNHNTNFHTKKGTYELAGFTLQINGYEVSQKVIAVEHKKHLKLVEQMYVQLELDQEINLPVLRSKLGKPIAQMRLNKNSTLEIFNSFLTLEIKNSELTKMYLNQDSLLSKEYSDNSSWALGKFINGTPRKQLAKYFPQNSYESSNEVEIQSDKYTLSLLFDDESQSSQLNEAELSFWF